MTFNRVVVNSDSLQRLFATDNLWPPEAADETMAFSKNYQLFLNELETSAWVCQEFIDKLCNYSWCNEWLGCIAQVLLRTSIDEFGCARRMSKFQKALYSGSPLVIHGEVYAALEPEFVLQRDTFIYTTRKKGIFYLGDMNWVMSIINQLPSLTTRVIHPITNLDVTMDILEVAIKNLVAAHCHAVSLLTISPELLESQSRALAEAATSIFSYANRVCQPNEIDTMVCLLMTKLNLPYPAMWHWRDGSFAYDGPTSFV